ncbi:uncharacterized protein LOC131255111 [Magnolia sinica]|uniref:uncharacterized protein LOC131255111 n=1 Tax=Magnolia sinica TaxID=86752 RepID=UPI00265A97DE|nr:uncharacterized protein LOC131255111 [Magnolia sinica]
MRRKEAMFVERERLLNEKKQLKREKDLFFEDKEKLVNERKEFIKEKEYVQSYSNVKGNVLNASISHPVYERRIKKIPKPLYYKISSYLSLSAFDTTPAAVPEPEQVTTFTTSPIPFPIQMDPFRILSAHEAIDTYIEFLEKRHNDLSIAYLQDCKFCPMYFTQSLEGCLPVLIAYRASKSALERAKLLGQMGTTYTIAKQRDKPYAKAIWCYERVYAPINHENSHWFLLVIYPRAREIVVVDSLCTNLLLKYKQKMKKMTDALPILFHATGDSTALEGKKWTVRVNEYAPKQDNGYDCGIFVMKYIDILCSGLTLAGIDMQKFTADWRKSIAYDCLSLVCR